MKSTATKRPAATKGTRRTSSLNTIENHAKAITLSVRRYDIDTRRAVRVALDNFKHGHGSEAELDKLIARAEAGEMILDAEGVEAQYVDAAKSVLALISGKGSVPDFIASALIAAFDEYERRSPARVWRHVDDQEPDDATANYSASAMARVFQHDAAMNFYLEPVKDLAELVAAVISHKDTPEDFRETIRNGLLEMQNSHGIAGALTDTPEVIGLTVKMFNEREKGDASQ